MEKLGGLTITLLVAVLVGALNWGLIGLFNFNLVDAIFGGGSREDTSALSRIVYSVVGLCALALIALLPRLRETRRAERRPVSVTP